MFTKLRNFLQNKLITSHSENQNVNVQNKDGWTPLHTAVYKGKKEDADLLIKQNCHVNARIYDHSDEYPGYTALLLALETHCDGEFLLMLINAGTDLEICNKKGETALHSVLNNSFSHEVIRQLLHKGAHVNILDIQGWSPLHKAAVSIDCDLIQSLLDFGSDIHKRCSLGHLAIDWARITTKRAIKETRDGYEDKETRKGIKSLEILIKAGASIEELKVNEKALGVYIKSCLMDLLIYSGTRIGTCEGGNPYDWNLTLELSRKQQELKSLQRLAGNIVRRNLWPNALYGVSKLPLPVALQRFVCFHDVKIKVDPD